MKKKRKGDGGGCDQDGEAPEKKEEKQKEERGRRRGWRLLGEDEGEGGGTTPFKQMTKRWLSSTKKQARIDGEGGGSEQLSEAQRSQYEMLHIFTLLSDPLVSLPPGFAGPA